MLQSPAIAVGIAEVNERAPRLDVDLADLDAAPREFVVRFPRVLDDHLQSLDRARLHVR